MKRIEDQIDYGMRVYDPRVGRFMSVDPIFKKYPELSTYQYSSNRPIDGIDLDGLEYVSHIFGKFEYKGDFWDYLKTIPNAAANIGNGVLDLWNSGVANYQSLRRGTWQKDITGELKQMGNGVKDYAVNSWD